MKKMIITSLLSVTMLAGCAKNTSELGKAYVSPMMYEDYSCQQLKGEMMRLTRRAEELTKSVNDNAQGDSVAMGLGLVLFWPALFFIDGDSPEAQEYRQIRGEYDAVEKTLVMKQCGGVPEKNPFTEAEKAYKNQNQQQNRYPSQKGGIQR